jgi:hypothetical protein
MFWSRTSRTYFGSSRSTTAIVVVFTLVVLVILSRALPLQHPASHKEKRSDVVCGAASWNDIVAFFVLNYLAHAATIRHFPGDTARTQMWWTACALFFPFAGVWRACQSIANARPFEKDELKRAKYAGALCVINVLSTNPSQWRSRDLTGCRIRGKAASSRDEEGFVVCTLRQIRSTRLWRLASLGEEKIHGSSTERWFRVVPPKVEVFNRTRTKVVLSSSSSMVKCAVAIVQVGFACLTLYRTRSDQVAKYGYAAFGLTVIPYAVMSIINLIANLLTPEYPTIFIVHSDGMDEFVKQGEEFDGIVGTIVPPERSDPGFYSKLPVRGITWNADLNSYNALVQIPEGYIGEGDEELEVQAPDIGRYETIPNFSQTQKVRNLVAIGIGIVGLVTPYVLIAIFTDGFQTGSISTPVQRVFVMSWLVVGQVFGALSVLYEVNFFKVYEGEDWEDLSDPVVSLLPVIAPALGGFVVVGLMIKQFGSCVLV